MQPEHASVALADEQALVLAAKKGDNAAFTDLYDYYFPKIYSYLYKRVGHQQTTEDITSKTFMKVFCHLEKYEYQQCSFSSWVYKIATNNLIDYYRKAGKRTEVDIEAIPELVDTQMSVEKDIDSAYDAKIVRKVLMVVKPPKYQKVLHLKYIAELEYEEVAEAMGISVNNARVITHRALKKFNTAYKKYAEQR